MTKILASSSEMDNLCLGMEEVKGHKIRLLVGQGNRKVFHALLRGRQAVESSHLQGGKNRNHIVSHMGPLALSGQLIFVGARRSWSSPLSRVSLSYMVIATVTIPPLWGLFFKASHISLNLVQGPGCC